nr:hypothetical protein BaRGS_005061 [Batillaria attramentaria]
MNLFRRQQEKLAQLGADVQGGGGRGIPTNQPLSVEADQPISDFDYHIYSTLPTIKPLRSSNRGHPLDLPDLEKERKFQDYSKPLWTNTDLPGPAPHGPDDSHSPPSDNAVSSSDSRDTIIAKSDDTKSTLQESLPDVKSEPKMIPVRVVHEDSGRGPAAGRTLDRMSETDAMEPLWGKRGTVARQHVDQQASQA